MQSFLAKCAVVGIVAAGFTLTGDLGRLADRGRQVLQATGVPADRVAATNPETPQPPAAPALSPDVTPPVPPREARRVPEDAPADAPVGRPAALPLPMAGGVDVVDLGSLAAGDRLLVWVRRPGSSGHGRPDHDVLALDVIDPTAGEALEHRHAAATTGDRGPIHAAPRRVIIVADQPGRLATGDPLRLTPVRGVNGAGPVEEIGRVLALEVRDP